MSRSAIGVAVCLLIICLAALSTIRSLTRGDHTPEDQSWWYDTERGETFLGASLRIPPIESPWGNEAVRVFFFSCGTCAEDERFPGFYWKFDPTTRSDLLANPERIPSALGESYPGRLYSADGTNWVEAASVGQSGVTRQLGQRCPGKLRSCR